MRPCRIRRLSPKRLPRLRLHLHLHLHLHLNLRLHSRLRPRPLLGPHQPLHLLPHRHRNRPVPRRGPQPQWLRRQPPFHPPPPPMPTALPPWVNQRRPALRWLVPASLPAPPMPLPSPRRPGMRQGQQARQAQQAQGHCHCHHHHRCRTSAGLSPVRWPMRRCPNHRRHRRPQHLPPLQHQQQSQSQHLHLHLKLQKQRQPPLSLHPQAQQPACPGVRPNAKPLGSRSDHASQPRPTRFARA